MFTFTSILAVSPVSATPAVKRASVHPIGPIVYVTPVRVQVSS